jgi:hypothetical protein
MISGIGARALSLLFSLFWSELSRMILLPRFSIIRILAAPLSLTFEPSRLFLFRGKLVSSHAVSNPDRLVRAATMFQHRLGPLLNCTLPACEIPMKLGFTA